MFRGDANLGPSFITTVSDIEIHLSTTLKTVDGLSSVFDQNVGSDDRIIVGRNPIVLTGVGGDHQVAPWSIVFDITSNPFRYNPAAGNLLLDIKVFSGDTTAPFDAVDRTGDEVSSVFQYGRSLPTSGQTSSLGLATFFAVQPVPEPSTWALFGLGLLGLLAIGRKTPRREGKSR